MLWQPVMRPHGGSGGGERNLTIEAPLICALGHAK